MPLFDMACSNCGAHVKDVLVSKPHHEHVSMACPQCKKIGSLKKLPSRSNFSVKGRFTAANGYSGGNR